MVLLVFSVALFRSPSWMYSSFVLLNFCALASHFIAEPFHLPIENRVETAALSLLLLLSVILTAGAPPLPPATEVVVSIIVLAAVAAFLVLYAWKWREAKRKRSSAAAGEKLERSNTGAASEPAVELAAVELSSPVSAAPSVEAAV